MPKEEGVKARDEVSFILYDENGNIKETRISKRSLKEKIFLFIKKVIENW